MYKKQIKISDVKNYYGEDKLSIASNLIILMTALLGLLEKLEGINLSNVFDFFKMSSFHPLHFILIVIYLVLNQRKKIILWKENRTLKKSYQEELEKNSVLSEFYNKMSQQHSIHFSHIIKATEEFKKISNTIEVMARKIEGKPKVDFNDIKNESSIIDDANIIPSFEIVEFHELHNNYLTKNLTKGFKRFLKDSVDEHQLLLSKILGWHIPISVNLLESDTKVESLVESKVYNAFVDSATLYNNGYIDKKSYYIDNLYAECISNNDWKRLIDYCDNENGKRYKTVIIINSNMVNSNYQIFGILRYDISSLNEDDCFEEKVNKLQQFAIAYSETLSYYCTVLNRELRNVSSLGGDDSLEGYFDFLGTVRKNF